MSRQRRSDTRPEVALRRELHGRGLRFRVDIPALATVRSRADIVFTKARIAIFVDGCFWHCCPEHATFPKANRAWWSEKLRRNVERDRETDAGLTGAGWSVIRVWEHEDPVTAAGRIEVEVRRRRGG